MSTIEIWKDITGYEGLYACSNLGRIKKGLKIRKTQITNRGYERVNLCKNGAVRRFSMHQIVAKTFIPNPDNKKQVNHLNGIRNDNRSENLEWCTQSENQTHAFKIGLQKGNIGENNGRSKISNSDALYIRQEYDKNTGSIKKLSEIFNVSTKTIRRIISNQTFYNI